MSMSLARLGVSCGGANKKVGGVARLSDPPSGNQTNWTTENTLQSLCESGFLYFFSCGGQTITPIERKTSLQQLRSKPISIIPLR